MKIALVHDWLNTKIGGGEQVLLELADLYPQADIYTLLFDADNYSGLLDPQRVHASVLQRFPGWLRRRSRYLLPLVPMAIEQFDLSGYDIVISTSSAFAKGVITRPETLHLCYCFSPMRFVWDYWPQYLEDQHVGPVRRIAIRRLTSRLRLWDFYSASRVDSWVAISQVVQDRIAKFYRQPSQILYPPVNLEGLSPSEQKDEYYITLATLTPYKRIDLAIQACNLLQRPLVVLSDGPDRKRLEAMAGPTIRFTGRVSEAEKAKYVSHARALLFPNEEDFGIAPIDAMASGTPVIAYRRGGLTETVIEGKTGLFFDEPTPEALAAAMKQADNHDFKLQDMTAQAAKFDARQWRRAFKHMVEKEYQDYVKANHL